MRFTRLISAITVVAAVTVLGSCGQSSAPTAASTTDPSLELGIRDYTIMPNQVSWSKQPADPIPTDTKTVLISGLIAAASYPLFGAPVYSDANQSWLNINTAPNFSRSPIGWNVTFHLNPVAQSLPIGTYTATIPVNIPGATNNPQNIVVTFTNCGNCLLLGDRRLATISAGPTFSWFSNDWYNTSAYSYYASYQLLLQPGQTAWIIVYSSAFAGGNTLSDPGVAVYNTNPPLYTSVGYDDDSCLGLTSVFGGAYPGSTFYGSAGPGVGPGLTNTGTTTKIFQVRIGTWGGGLATGTETIFISPTNPCPGSGGGDLRMPIPDSVQAIMNAKAGMPLGH